jgi:LysM repeat protein
MKRTLIIILSAVVMLAAALPATQAQLISLTCTQSYTIQRGDTLAKIARSFGTTVANLQAWNKSITNPNRIYAGTSICVKATGGTSQPVGKTYIVKAGDTLAKIARSYGVSMTVLAQINNISDVNKIFVGQALVIPDVTIQ